MQSNIKESIFSRRAYLGDCGHLGSSNTTLPLIHSEEHLRKLDFAIGGVRLMRNQNNSLRQSIEQSKESDLKHLQQIRTMFRLFKYLHQQFGIEGNLSGCELTNLQQGVGEIINMSQWIVNGVVQKLRAVQYNRREIQTAKEAALRVASEADDKSTEVDSWNKQLQLAVKQLQNKIMHFEETNMNLLRDNSSLIMELQRARKQYQKVSMDLENGTSQLMKARQEGEIRVLMQSDSDNIRRVLQQKQQIIVHLKAQNESLLQQQIQHRDQLLNLQRLISLQKQQNHQICSEYQRQLQQSDRLKTQAELGLVQELKYRESQILNLQKIGKLNLNQLETVKVKNIEYEQQREIAMNSLNNITIRIRDYEKQSSEERVNADNEINSLKKLFSDLEKKYLDVVMRAAKWVPAYNIINLKLRGQNLQDVHFLSAQCQTESELLQTQLNVILKTYEAKSETRLNQLCKINQILRKQNEKLSSAKEDLIKKICFLEKDNEGLRNELNNNNRKIALSKISEQGTLINSELIDMGKSEVIKSIGSKIETLREIMKSLEEEQEKELFNKEASIEEKCVGVTEGSNHLEYLFETQPINCQISQPIRYNLNPQLQSTLQSSQTKRVNKQITIVRSDSFQLRNNSILPAYQKSFPIYTQQRSQLVQSQGSFQLNLSKDHRVTSQLVYNQGITQRVPSTNKVQPKSKPKVQRQSPQMRIPIVNVSKGYPYPVFK